MADTAAFDTLATARRLKAAGIVGTQAEAVRAGRGDLASKADSAALKADIATLKIDLYRVALWQCAFMVAVAAVAIGLMQALG